MLLIALLIHPEAEQLTLLHKLFKDVSPFPNHSEQHVLGMCLGFQSGSGIEAFIFLRSFTSKLGHSEECFQMALKSHIMET